MYYMYMCMDLNRVCKGVIGTLLSIGLYMYMYMYMNIHVTCTLNIFPHFQNEERLVYYTIILCTDNTCMYTV